MPPSQPMDEQMPETEPQPAAGSPAAVKRDGVVQPPSPPSADFPESPGSGGQDGALSLGGPEGSGGGGSQSTDNGPGPAAYGIQECDTIPGDAQGDGPRYK